MNHFTPSVIEATDAAHLHSLREEIASIIDRPPRFAFVSLPFLRGSGLQKAREVVIGFSQTFGRLLPQGPEHPEVKEVRDRGLVYDDHQTARYSDTKKGGHYHTDGAEIREVVDLLLFYCHQQAPVGGELVLIDALQLMDSLAAQYPRDLEVLSRDVEWDARIDDRTTFRKPVFQREGEIVCHYLKHYIESGYQKAGSSMPEEVAEALAHCEDLIGRPENQLVYKMSPGELILMNNKVWLHGRRSFEDAPAQPRILLRTWVNRGS